MTVSKSSWPDPGAEHLILVGPIMKWALTPAQLDTHGIAAAPQIAIDGGIEFAHQPFMWTGDGDSGTKPTNIPAILKENQNETDLRFCLNGIRLWGWRELHLFGFVGQRRDHELANFGEIHGEMRRRPEFRRGVFYGNNFTPLAAFYSAGDHIFKHQGLFSTMAFEPATVTIWGDCEYPATSLPLEPFSGAGISNVASGDVRISSDKPVAIFFPPQAHPHG